MKSLFLTLLFVTLPSHAVIYEVLGMQGNPADEARPVWGMALIGFMPGDWLAYRGVSIKGEFVTPTGTIYSATRTEPIEHINQAALVGWVYVRFLSPSGNYQANAFPIGKLVLTGAWSFTYKDGNPYYMPPP